LNAPKRQPDLAGRPTEVVQRIRIRYAKRGRLRFTSHRDITRAFERAIRRAGVPMAYSSGFTAHPRVSWANAAPTGAASEAEYVEIGLCELRDPEQLRLGLDHALAPGLDVLEAVTAQAGTGKLADHIDSSCWELRVYGSTQQELEKAAEGLLAAESAQVERVTKDGRRTIDVRAALVSAVVTGEEESPIRVSPEADPAACAILTVVVQQTTPVVRPDDVLAALSSVAGLPVPISSLVTRMAQGRLLEDGSIVDPLTADREAGVASAVMALQSEEVSFQSDVVALQER
jgi:radical SAM-linked protein